MQTFTLDPSKTPVGMSSTATTAQNGNPWVDGLVGLVQLYYADRQAERQAPAQYAEWQLNAVQGHDVSNTQNPNAPSAGLLGRSFNVGGTNVSTGAALVGLLIAGVALVAVLK